MLSAFQIPPPTAIRSVTHVISIPTLRPLTRTFLSAGNIWRDSFLKLSVGNASSSFRQRDSTRGETESALGPPPISASLPRFILRYPLRAPRGLPPRTPR